MNFKYFVALLLVAAPFAQAEGCLKSPAAAINLKNDTDKEISVKIVSIDKNFKGAFCPKPGHIMKIAKKENASDFGKKILEFGQDTSKLKKSGNSLDQGTFEFVEDIILPEGTIRLSQTYKQKFDQDIFDQYKALGRELILKVSSEGKVIFDSSKAEADFKNDPMHRKNNTVQVKVSNMTVGEATYNISIDKYIDQVITESGSLFWYNGVYTISRATGKNK